MLRLLLICACAGDAAPDAALLENLARQALLDALPERHESLKDWGKTAGRFDFKHEGGLRFERRVKQVNHGLWKKYAVEPLAPRKQLVLRLGNVVRKPDGTTTFSCAVQTPLAAEATVQSWAYGVKVFGMTVNAEATVVARIDCAAKFTTRWEGFAPRFVVAPSVTDIQLGLHDFKLKKIGALGSRLARELEDEAAKLLRRKLAEQQPKLVAKANKALLKRHPTGEYGWSPLDGLLR